MKTLSVYLRRLTLLLLSLTLFVGQITGRGANNIQALQQQLSDVVAENELVRLVTTQAIHNEEMLTKVQLKFQNEFDRVTHDAQLVADDVAKAQRQRQQQILTTAQQIQRVMDNHDPELRQTLLPASTWLVSK